MNNTIKNLIAETAKTCTWSAPELIQRTVQYVTTAVPLDSGKGVKPEDALENVGPWFGMPVGIPHPDENKEDEYYYVAGARNALAIFELVFSHVPGLTSRQTLGGYGWVAQKEQWPANSMRSGGPRNRTRSVAELRKARFAYDVLCSLIPVPADWRTDPKDRKKVIPVDADGNPVNEYIQIRALCKAMHKQALDPTYRLTGKSGGPLTEEESLDLATSEGENQIKSWLEAGLLGPLGSGAGRSKGFRWLSPAEKAVTEEERKKKDLPAFSIPPTLDELEEMERQQAANVPTGSRRGRLSSTDREELERAAMERSRELLDLYMTEEKSKTEANAKEEPPTREEGKRKKNEAKHQHA